jgi:hypothetical protein
MKREILYVSDGWLRAHTYERGKQASDETLFGLSGSVHLAEARAILATRRFGRDDEPGPPPNRNEGVSSQ